MADDYWRDHRRQRQRARRSWYECPECGMYMTAPKVAPGDRCHLCGWETPEREKASEVREMEGKG